MEAWDSSRTPRTVVRRPLLQSSLWKLTSRLVAAALCNFLWTQGSFCNKQVFILLNMDSGHHIVTVRVI
jgi:hypothetical protein